MPMQTLIVAVTSGRTYTLLQLMNELEPKLHELRHIYNVHARAVCSWKTSPNWLSASRYVPSGLLFLNVRVRCK